MTDIDTCDCGERNPNKGCRCRAYALDEPCNWCEWWNDHDECERTEEGEDDNGY